MTTKMRYPLNESEAWTAIGDVMVGLESMPIAKDGQDYFRGLCAIVFTLRGDMLISKLTMAMMLGRINREMRKRKIYTGWLATPGAWKPRLPYVRQFAKDAATGK